MSAAVDEQRRRLVDVAALYPFPTGRKFSYGTAGFRSEGKALASTVCRAAALAALRSLACGGAAVGLMITASHNPIADNGVKIADPDGGMMSQSWEPFADALANAANPSDFADLFLHFVNKEQIFLGGEQHAQVLLGRDTRPTGEYLIEAATHGVNAVVGAVAQEMGVLTTPQLHWMVRRKNKGMKASETDYLGQLSRSFQCLIDLVPEAPQARVVDRKVIIDGANGVGGPKIEALKPCLPSLEIHMRNSGKEGEGVLNELCGADYVQKEKVAPCNFGPSDVGVRCASLDGDADRLVYFHLQSPNSTGIELVDGDKILTLFVLFIWEQLEMITKNVDGSNQVLNARLGIVQTAYANGAATAYLRNLGLEVVFTPTGVKYLHKKALEYDIGVYFEANGHGTILLSAKFLCQLESLSKVLSSACPGSEHQKAALRLLSVSKLINQAVGDALSGMLLVEAILQYKHWSIKNWCDLYSDLPSRQLKVKVMDRSAIITTDAETRVTKPEGLQDVIDKEIAKYSLGRCFVRPSGTEDVVRVYAEASTQKDADALAKSVAEHVDQLLGYNRSN